jgi:hypothetical protein
MRYYVNVDKVVESLYAFGKRLGLEVSYSHAQTGTVYVDFTEYDGDVYKDSVCVRVSNHASLYREEDISIDPVSGYRPWEVMSYICKRFNKPVPPMVRRYERREEERIAEQRRKAEEYGQELVRLREQRERIEAWIKEHRPEVWEEWLGPNAVSGNKRKAGRGPKRRWDAAWDEAINALNNTAE